VQEWWSERFMPYRSRHCFPIRPGKAWAIVDHFFGPYFCTISIMMSSSWKGERTNWYGHTKTQPVNVYKIKLKRITNQIGGLTSLDHGPLINSGFRTFCHLCRHCTSVLSGKHSAGKVKDYCVNAWSCDKTRGGAPTKKGKKCVD
jgi:hypothetical protein